MLRPRYRRTNCHNTGAVSTSAATASQRKAKQSSLNNPLLLKASLKSCKKMSTNTKFHIIPDEEETPVNTERVLTLRYVWTIKAYRQNGWFLYQVNLVNCPLEVFIFPIECSLCCIGTCSFPWKVRYLL